jgi:Bacterial Ig-like domain (group 3)/FG-GAP repeat/FG-GAP-like repeat
MTGGVRAGGLLSSLFIAIVFAGQAPAQQLLTDLQARLEGAGIGGEKYARFGRSVAIDGDTAVVGSPYDDTAAGLDGGSAYVFVRAGDAWVQQAQLFPAPAAQEALFGSSVSVHGDTIVVGAPNDSANGDPRPGTRGGCAYVFVRNGTTWMQQARLTGASVTTLSFGSSVSVNGDTVLIGSYGDTTLAGFSAGSVFVFVRSGTAWTQQARLQDPDGAAADDGFGYAVSLSGDSAVIGAHHDDAAGPNAGSAFVFVRSGTAWSRQAQLLSPAPGEQDRFGSAVAIDGDTLIVGTDLPDSFPPTVGRAQVFVRTGSTWSHQAELTAADGAPKDQFGSSVGLRGDTAVVGSYADDTAAGLGAGSAYVFVRSGTGWTQQAQLTAPAAQPQDQFGVAVAIDGDTVVTGVHHDVTAGGPEAGSAFVFVRQGMAWPQQAYLQPATVATGDRFGWSVAVDGDTAVVGTFGDDTGSGSDAGKAYVFVRNGSSWSQQAQLEASDGAEEDFFGYRVAVSGDTALVTAFQDDHSGRFNVGSGYVFVRNGTTWTQQAKLVATDAVNGDRLGLSAALDGDTAVLGALTDGAVADPDSGSVYVFTRSGTAWTQQARLNAPDPHGRPEFGLAVAIEGDLLVAGATGDDTAATNAGAAYVFTRSGTGWTLQQQLLASDGATGDRIGTAVAADGDTLLIGAGYDNTPAGAQVGSVYVFVRTGGTWTQQARLAAPDGAADDQFGTAVALHGNVAIAGAPLQDSPRGFDSGAAYVFVRSGSTWMQEAKLSAPDGMPTDRFAAAVAMSGTTAVFGSPQDDSATDLDAGSAYLYLVQPRGVAVHPVAGLVTSEGGATAAFTMTLQSQPSADVTIALSSSDPTEGTVSPASVTFTPANYSVPQSVTVTGVDDAAADGPLPYAIVTASAVSADPQYNGFNARDVGFINQDDDAAVQIGSSLNPSDIGAAVTFTATVTPFAGTASGSVTFKDGAAIMATVALSGGVASHTTSTLSGGNHSITASYSGDGTYRSSDAALTQTVRTGSTIAVSASRHSRKEDGGPLPVTVTRTGGDTSGPASVAYGTANGTAAAGVRYAHASGTLQFASGETSKTVSIDLIDASGIEGNQWFTLALSNPDGGVLGNATATIEVVDDDTAVSDFSFPLDANSDLVWRNESTGDTRVWRMNGTTFTDSADLPQLGGDWKLQGAADFNADGSADLLYRNMADHSLTVWSMSGTGVLSSGPIPGVPDANWKIVAMGDMNGDGYPDLVWRHTSFALALWLMRDRERLSAHPLPTIADNNWQVKGLGDFNRDGQLDMVWRHGPNSVTAVWLMKPGGLALDTGTVLTTAGPPWDVVGVGDMNKDGDADLIWQASTTRTVAVWLMNRTTRTSVVVLPTINDPGWNVAGPR